MCILSRMISPEALSANSTVNNSPVLVDELCWSLLFHFMDQTSHETLSADSSVNNSPVLVDELGWSLLFHFMDQTSHETLSADSSVNNSPVLVDELCWSLLLHLMDHTSKGDKLLHLAPRQLLPLIGIKKQHHSLCFLWHNTCNQLAFLASSFCKHYGANWDSVT